MYKRQLFRHLIDSTGIVDDAVLDKLKLNIRSLIACLLYTSGDSPSHVYTELIRMHKEEGLSFRNVIVFNMYEYYPLAPDAINSNFNYDEWSMASYDLDKEERMLQG